MKPSLQIASVAGGYVLALLVAGAAVALHMAMAGESGTLDPGGMGAFGDLVLFAAVFAAAASVPTGVAIFFFCTRKRGAAGRQSPPPG
ncbi:MAG TPA: hypothetical protein VG838_11780 [Opitutaceae bacterium]|nr:hypothetical protein [Opitutaceae bacterium]